MKILVAADGSPFTKRMLAYLAAHDEWLGAHHEYTLLNAVPAVPWRQSGWFNWARWQFYSRAQTADGRHERPHQND